MRQDAGRLLLEQRVRKVREAFDNRPGMIHEVKEGPNGEIGIRAVVGGYKGKPYVTQWLYPSNQHGGDTERHNYRKGQNVLVSWNNGRPQVHPYAPNKKNPVPKHAKDAGLKTKTHQLGKTRTTRKDGAADWWIAKQGEQEEESSSNGLGEMGWGGSGSGASGSSQQAAGQGGQQQQSDDPAVHNYIDESGGTGGRVVDKKVRYAAHEKGAKIRADDKAWAIASLDDKIIYCHGEEDCIVSKPWTVKKHKDPVPNHDDLIKGEQGSQQTGGQSNQFAAGPTNHALG